MCIVKQARDNLIRHAFDRICNVPSYSNFRRNTFCVIANLGLQLKAKEEGLFEGEDWHNSAYHNELIQKVKAFLVKHIR